MFWRTRSHVTEYGRSIRSLCADRKQAVSRFRTLFHSEPGAAPNRKSGMRSQSVTGTISVTGSRWQRRRGPSLFPHF